MRALATRELIVATRTAAVPLAGLTILALSTAFVLAWAPGVPMLLPMNLYDQLRVLHWTLLAIVLPWTAVRCAPNDRTDAVGLMAALVRIGPARAIGGKIAGSLLVQSVVVLTGVPALVLAQQASAVPMAGLVADLLPLLGLALLIAAASTAAMLLAADEVRAWIWSSVLVLAVLMSAAGVAPDLSRLGALCALTGSVVTACLCSVVGRFVGSQNGPDGH
jgi:hypothetical protein